MYPSNMGKRNAPFISYSVTETEKRQSKRRVVSGKRGHPSQCIIQIRGKMFNHSKRWKKKNCRKKRKKKKFPLTAISRGETFLPLICGPREEKTREGAVSARIPRGGDWFFSTEQERRERRKGKNGKKHMSMTQNLHPWH